MQLLFGPDTPVLASLTKARRKLKIERVRIIVAWARVTGVGLLFDALGGKESVAEVIVGMSGGATSAEALAHLRARCAGLYVFHKHHRQTFHPKIYCLDTGGRHPNQATLIVGSSNMTGGGLFSNIEGNVLLDLKPKEDADHEGMFNSVSRVFGDLSRSPYCERIVSDARIDELLQDRYLGTETSLRRKSSEDATAAPKLGRRRSMPESPPPIPPKFNLPPLSVTFSAPGSKKSKTRSGKPPNPSVVDDLIADGRFFVRTLTANDIAKVKGLQTGTFEPDLSVTARDAQATFWGWPDQFSSVERTEGKPRDEWVASARVVTSVTPAEGETLRFVQWFRPSRPADLKAGIKGHAAEHRFQLGPIARVRAVLPKSFDDEGLVVVARCDEDEPEDFVVRFIAKDEPDHAEYKRFLSEKRPAHAYGYGTGDALD